MLKDIELISIESLSFSYSVKNEFCLTKLMNSISKLKKNCM